MNPLEFLLAGLRGEAPQAAPSPMNDPEMPGLMPGAPAPMRGQAAIPGASDALAGRSQPAESPISVLRALLQGRADAPDPEGAALGASISKAMPAPAQAPGTAVDSMPAPSSDPSRRAMFSQPSPAPSPAQAGGGSWQPTSAPATVVAPAQAGGIKPSDVQSFVRALMMGAAGVNPTAPKFSAFAQGAAGAMGQQYKESEAAAAREAQKAKLGFDQTLALRKDSREERGAARADTDQTRKNALADAQVKKLTREMSATSGIPGLSIKDAQKLNDQLNLYADRIKPYVYTVDDMQARLKTERDRLLKDYVSGQVAPKAEAAPVTRQARGPDGKVVTLVLKNGQWVPQQ